MDKESRKIVFICKCRQFLIDYVESQDFNNSCEISCQIDEDNNRAVFYVKAYYTSILSFPLNYCEYSGRWKMSELEYTTEDHFKFYTFKEKRIGDVCLEEI